jgi:preprotein translocase subunit SecA
VEEQWDLVGLERVLSDEWQIQLPLRETVASATAITDDEILEMVLTAANNAFKVKLDAVGIENFVPFERVVLLQSIDTHWREHLSSLDYLRQGIHLRGYAQKQPKQEYKREAFELFGQLLDSVKNEVTRVLMNVKIESSEQIGEAAQVLEERAENISNVTYTAPDEQGQQQTQAEFQSKLLAPVGRNEPCPCGSGKKYKFCHGKLG